jgi:hypothetical protein
LKENNIQLFLSPSKYTNKNRVVDRVIRTIRDKIGENPEKFYKAEFIQKALKNIIIHLILLLIMNILQKSSNV